MTKITREEAVKFFIEQRSRTDEELEQVFPFKECWHWGKCELHELLDKIYGVETKAVINE